MFVLKELWLLYWEKYSVNLAFLTFDPSFIPISSFFNLMAYVFEYATHGIMELGGILEAIQLTPYSVWEPQEPL